jgi:hypothetical protein
VKETAVCVVDAAGKVMLQRSKRHSQKLPSIQVSSWPVGMAAPGHSCRSWQSHRTTVIVRGGREPTSQHTQSLALLQPGGRGDHHQAGIRPKSSCTFERLRPQEWIQELIIAG